MTNICREHPSAYANGKRCCDACGDAPVFRLLHGAAHIRNCPRLLGLLQQVPAVG